jgi:hypothetical protein
LEFTRHAGDGVLGDILVAEWTPSGGSFAFDAGAGAAGASEPDETSLPLKDWIAGVEGSQDSERPRAVHPKASRSHRRKPATSSRVRNFFELCEGRSRVAQK